MIWNLCLSESCTKLKHRCTISTLSRFVSELSPAVSREPNLPKL
jgi:hypothetical protein